jgi:hypothetical protein
VFKCNGDGIHGSHKYLPVALSNGRPVCCQRLYYYTK